MGLFSRKKKEPDYELLRMLEKMKQSDLFEYLKERKKMGINDDQFMGLKIPKFEENPLVYFTMHLAGLNSGIVTKESFPADFSESEINAIMGESETTILSHPSRCVKDLVWWYMVQKESGRLAEKHNDKKSAERIYEIVANRRKAEKWLDWDRALDEFWIDESEKDYRSYIISS